VPHQRDSRFNGFFTERAKPLKRLVARECACHTWLKPGVNEIASHSCSGQFRIAFARAIALNFDLPRADVVLM
jgi:hypothetical protein